MTFARRLTDEPHRSLEKDASAAGLLRGKAAFAQFGQQQIDVVTLNLDHSVLERAAGAAALLQRAGQFLERLFGQRHAAYGGDGLAATALGFTAYAGDAVAFGNARLFADACIHRLVALRAMATAIRGIDETAQGGE